MQNVYNGKLIPKQRSALKLFFVCSWQDQPLDLVELDNLADRLGQNYMAETLGNLWLDYIFEKDKIARV